MIEIPQVRLTIEYLRTEIIHAVHTQSDQFKNEFITAIDAAIKNFDYKGEVTKIANAVIREEIERQIRDSVGSLRYDKGARKQFLEMFKTSLTSNLSDEK